MLEINKIYNMNCMDGLRLIDKHTIDLVVTDPPFNVDLDKKSELQSRRTKGTYENPIERDKNYIEFNINYDIYLRELYRVLKENSHFYIFCGDEQVPILINKSKEIGFKFSTICFWLVPNKTSFNMASGYSYKRKTEILLFFRKGNLKLKDECATNVFEFNTIKQKSRRRHPAEKPLSLIKKIILNSSNENDLVLDTFMGSGSTAIASKELNRNFIGFELSKYFYDLIIQRIKNHENNLMKWM